MTGEHKIDDLHGEYFESVKHKSAVLAHRAYKRSVGHLLVM